MKKKFMFVFVIGALALAACGGGGAGGPDANRGKALYEQSTIGTASAPGCVTCHTLDGAVLVGPSFKGVASRAENIIKDPSYTGSAKTAEEYLRESIINPNAYLNPGFAAGVMYQDYGTQLSEQEVNDLVAYLLTLK
ncbi:MAG: cytochrome c [Anaerolineales bacterium]|nr:cytochrome c [Anaerolineales bacterium]